MRYSQRASSSVSGLLSGEVERVETFRRRKMRGAYAALDHAPFAIDELAAAGSGAVSGAAL
jgi:hypothetical protein